MDYKTLTDEQLQQLSDQDFNQLCEDIMSEQVRRNRLREIPEEVKAKTLEYIEVGGDSGTLTDSINQGVSEREASIEAERVEGGVAQEGVKVEGN